MFVTLHIWLITYSHSLAAHLPILFSLSRIPFDRLISHKQIPRSVQFGPFAVSRRQPRHPFLGGKLAASFGYAGYFSGCFSLLPQAFRIGWVQTARSDRAGGDSRLWGRAQGSSK